jgi:AcrR family transcriptional regulator
MKTPRPISAPPRKRAPSKRALATKTRVFDAAEKVFAERGFDGATIRDIAAEAGEPVGTIHHHGGGKEALFHQVVARRAETLAQLRLTTLDAVTSQPDHRLEEILSAFVRPFFDLARDDPRWQHYARLVAFVCADPRWAKISESCFDPVAQVFVQAICERLPQKTRDQVAEGFVFTVSAMLAVLTSQHRFNTLGEEPTEPSSQMEHLIAFAAAGFQT